MPSVQVLELVDIFNDLQPYQLELIYEICKEKIYYQGEIIFVENSPSTELYVILEGEVEILVSLDAIRRVIGEPLEPGPIATLREGQALGEIALVDEGLRTATARCKSLNCKLLEINRQELMDLLRRELDIGFIVMSNLAAELCVKIRQANLNLRELLLYTHQQG